MRSYLFLLLCLVICIAGMAQGPQTAINVHVNSFQTRPALLYLPNDYNSTTTQYPLLVFLHGAGERGENLQNIYNSSNAGGPAYFIAHNQWPVNGFVNPADAQTYKFIVVSPQASQASAWSISAAELTYIMADLVATYRVNTNRIYLMGISAGGMGIMNYCGRIGVTPTYKPAAVAPLSAAVNGNDKATIVTNTTADSVRAWGQGQTTGCDVHGESTKYIIDGMNNLRPGIARFTEITDCHTKWNPWIIPTYRESVNGVQMNIYEWMLQYSRGGGGGPVNQPPVVNAGTDQTITLPTNSVNLLATATDADGTISSYSWTKVSGGAATIASSTAAATAITGLVAGSYLFRCTVTDNLGATASDDVTIQVNPQSSTVSRTMNINLYANNDPYNNAAWNDWNIIPLQTKSGLTFTDGSSSTISLSLSAQSDYKDNGQTYSGFTMCPDKVGRYASQYTGTRTLTISGLDNARLYDISLYASRINVAYSNVFTIGSASITIAVGNNKSNAASFSNITPINGAIVITIANAAGTDYNYLNGFTLIEKTPSVQAGNSYVITPASNGYKEINDASHVYQPGDTLFLSGNFKSMAFYNLMGSAAKKIVVTNRPGETLVIGDSTWSGGAWAQALVFRNCRYVEVAGSEKARFQIVGSTSNVLDAGGAPARTAYIDLSMTELSSDFICHNLTVRNGGAGIFAKTEVSATNPLTWYPQSTLSNWEFYDIDLSNTYNEAMYIGHTATYWNINTNQPHYPDPTDPVPDPAIYKQPVKLQGVKIHDMNITNIGNDAIQTAAIDSLQVYRNSVTDWATKHIWGDNGGILIGGRVKGFYVHDNLVHNGWGEFMQIFAEGGGTSLVENNLLYSNSNDGVSIRGTNNLIVNFKSNTVAYAGSNAVRINGYTGATGQNIIQNNILAQPRMLFDGTIDPKYYIYTENGGSAIEPSAPNDNKKFATAAEVNWNENNYFLPNAGSTAVGYGYRHEGSGLMFVYRNNN